MRIASATAALVVAGLLTGAVSAQQLAGAGSTFAAPIYGKWSEAFHQANPGLTINYQSIGSTRGIQQFKGRAVDFGATDAPLSDEELTGMPGSVVHLPTVAGAVVLAYELPGVTATLKLSGDVIADIFLGKITHWIDARIASLNPGVRLPNLGIAAAHRADGSGTTYLFTSYLAAVSPEWKTKVGSGKSVNWLVGIGSKGNEGVAGTVKQTPGSIGYVELAYAVQSKLPYAQIKNLSGHFITPSIESVTAAADGGAAALKTDIRTSIVNSPSPRAYPISGFTYILVYRDQPDPTKAKALLAFLHWGMRDGQALAPALYYAPLPKSVVTLNEVTLKSVTAAGKKIGRRLPYPVRTVLAGG